MQCATMNHRRKVTMNWDGLEDDEDDCFYESRDRMSTAAPLDLASDSEDFEDSRMSFASTISPSSSEREQPSPPAAVAANPVSMWSGYDMWMADPGDVKERRKRLLQGMGLGSSKGGMSMLRMASTKIARTVSKRREKSRASTPPLAPPPPVVAPPPMEEKSRNDESPSLPSSSNEPNQNAAVLGRSRSDSDIDAFSFATKQRKEELIGGESKQRLTRTSSELIMPSIKKSTNDRSPHPTKKESEGSFGSLFLIKNLDTGKEFIVKEYNDKGMWNKLKEVQTGKHLTMDEFEKSVGQSRLVKELMRRQKANHDGSKLNHLTKSFRSSKRKGVALLKNIKVVGSSKSLPNKEVKENEQPSTEDQSVSNRAAPSQWVKARQHGKGYKEFTALHLSQEIQAHEGSIWVIKFSSDSCFLASGGEDKVVHVWEVQECEIASMKPSDDLYSGGNTPVHPMASIVDRPTLGEATSTPSKRKGKTNKKKANSIPSYVNVPETVFALSEKPVCTFEGHQDDILDISWSKSQQLISSSMDKTVRMWDLEAKSCLKIFTHKDYVTCIQFNPVDDNYFISGSLDAKVRIWNIPERQVVDWIDAREMVTAATYTPDGQGAVIGSHQGMCRFYRIDDNKLEHTNDIQMKTKAEKNKKLPGFHPQFQAKKVTGFQFAPWNPSEVLITSTDSRIRIYNGEEIVQKFRGFRNTSSQISASFSPDGRHVISPSEDSQVYIWKVAEATKPSGGKKNKNTVRAYEYFHSKDLTVAIAWPGLFTNEPPLVEIHSKRHSKRSTSTSAISNTNTSSPVQSTSASSIPNVTANSPVHDENAAGAGNKRNFPPLPKKNVNSEGIANSEDDNNSGASSRPIDPGIGASSSSRATSPSPLSSSPLSHSTNGSSHGGQIVQATVWGMVIVTASLEGEIRVHQNFGLPRKVRFGD